MQSISKDNLIEMFRFVEKQNQFIIDTTKDVASYHDFLLSQTTMVLFNSTCMCLQTIGETVKKIDNLTQSYLLASYTEIPWRMVIGMRNILSHEYAAIDPEVIFGTVKDCLPPLLACTQQIIVDLESGKHNNLFTK